MASDIKVDVVGLTEFRKALKDAEAKWPKELGRAHKEIGDLVVTGATARAQGLGGVAAKTANAGGMKPSARSADVTILLGSARTPFALGAEFGGGARPTTRQFRPHLGQTGYFLYPTIRQTIADGSLVEKYAEVIDRVAHDAFSS